MNLVEVYDKVQGNLSLGFVKRHFKALKKTRKLSGFVIDSHLNDSVFIAVEREADLN